MTESKIHPEGPAGQAEPTQITSLGVSLITEHNAANARELVEDAIFAFAKNVRGHWFESDDELEGYVLGFLLQYPQIHNALVPKESR